MNYLRKATLSFFLLALSGSLAQATILIGPIEWDTRPGAPWSYAADMGGGPGPEPDCTPSAAIPSPAGGCALRFTYYASPGNPQTAWTPSYFAGEAGTGLTPVDDVWVGHWDYWATNFTWNHNGTKMDFLFWGYFDDPIATRDPGNMGVGFYGAGCGIPGGTQTDGFGAAPQILWGPGTVNHCWNFSTSEGQWHWIQYHASMNTPGQPDGLFEAYVDGTMVFADHTMAYRSLATSHFKGFAHDGNWGGGPGIIPETSYRWVDHTIVATTQQETNMPGGGSLPPAGILAPAAPRGILVM